MGRPLLLVEIWKIFRKQGDFVQTTTATMIADQTRFGAELGKFVAGYGSVSRGFFIIVAKVSQ